MEGVGHPRLHALEVDQRVRDGGVRVLDELEAALDRRRLDPVAEPLPGDGLVAVLPPDGRARHPDGDDDGEIRRVMQKYSVFPLIGVKIFRRPTKTHDHGGLFDNRFC